MLRLSFLLPCLLAGVLVFDPASADPLAGIAGRWRTVRHGALVDIRDCGDGTPCGYLVWVDPAITQGATADIRNPRPELRDRPLDGLPLLWGFTLTDGHWRDGRLYNPDDGKTFTSRVEPVPGRGLRVWGCMGPLCRTQLWTPAEGETGAATPAMETLQ